MKKIGIATYYNIYNYGSVLQAYALSKIIKDLGYDPYILDYTNENNKCYKKIRKKTYFLRLLTSMKSPKLLLNTLAIKFKGTTFIANITYGQKKMFEDFINNYLHLSNVDVLRNKDYFSGFVCGSDQIWQVSAPGLHEFYYLRFTDKEKRIAYAPSFGSLTVPWFNKTRLKKYLSEFSSISVRENSGKRIVNDLIGEDIPQVLDPVLLINPIYWQKFIEKSTENFKYIVGYFLGDISDYSEHINKIEKKYSTKMIILNSGRKQMMDRLTKTVSPETFVSYIANSSFVITDSLHGAEFSVVFKKQFIVLERNYITIPEQRNRLISLLELLNLNDRYIKKDCFINLSKDIDYNHIDNILCKEKDISIKYLNKALHQLK